MFSPSNNWTKSKTIRPLKPDLLQSPFYIFDLSSRVIKRSLGPEIDAIKRYQTDGFLER